MAIPAHKTEYFIIENSNLQKKANTALKKPPRRYAPQWFQIDSFGAEMLVRKNPCKKSVN